MNEGPVFTALNENNAINHALSLCGAPVLIKPFAGMAVGQRIIFTYEAYDKLEGGTQKFVWSITSRALIPEELEHGCLLTIPREQLVKHCYGHAKAYYSIEENRETSPRTEVYVDLRVGGICR